MYFVEVEIIRSEVTEAVVLGLDLESGKSFSLASDLDAQTANFKKTVFLLDALVFCIIPLGILLLFTVICIPVSLGLFWASWKALKARPGLKRSIKAMPTGSELLHFINSNRRDFDREQSALVS